MAIPGVYVAAVLRCTGAARRDVSRWIVRINAKNSQIPPVCRILAVDRYESYTASRRRHETENAAGFFILDSSRALNLSNEFSAYTVEIAVQLLIGRKQYPVERSDIAPEERDCVLFHRRMFLAFFSRNKGMKQYHTDGGTFEILQLLFLKDRSI